MKKLLLVLFVAGFIGFAFAFSPSRVVNSPEMNGTVLMDDTTVKAKKTDKTKKDCKSDCCKKSCSGKKAPKKKS